MNLEFFMLVGYGQFFWPAFIFTFISCLILYINTKKELQKYEKIFFSEHKQLYEARIKISERETTKKVLSGSSV